MIYSHQVQYKISVVDRISCTQHQGLWMWLNRLISVEASHFPSDMWNGCDTIFQLHNTLYLFTDEHVFLLIQTFLKIWGGANVWTCSYSFSYICILQFKDKLIERHNRTGIIYHEIHDSSMTWIPMAFLCLSNSAQLLAKRKLRDIPNCHEVALSWGSKIWNVLLCDEIQ